jgi:hypothetical protein
MADGVTSAARRCKKDMGCALDEVAEKEWKKIVSSGLVMCRCVRVRRGVGLMPDFAETQRHKLNIACMHVQM